MNQLLIEAILTELGAVRFTPAGVPIVTCRLSHSSLQQEAGQPREVSVELSAVAAGPLSALLASAAPGMTLRCSGFLAAKSLRGRTPVLHLSKIEFLEGYENGFQAQVEVQEKG